MNVTVKGLLEFIAQQDPARTVDHRSWNACAVGDYAREVHGHEIPLPSRGGEGTDYNAVRTDPVVLALYIGAGTSHKAMQEYGASYHEHSVIDWLAEQCGVSTYGELNEQMREEGFVC